MNLSEWIAVVLLVGLALAVVHTAIANRRQEEEDGEEFRYMTVREIMTGAGSFDDKDG
jgi:putative Mn2+ efflux pump MntP